MTDLILDQVPGWPTETRMYLHGSQHYLVTITDIAPIRQIVDAVALEVPDAKVPSELAVVTQIPIFLAEYDAATMAAPTVVDADGNALNGLTPCAMIAPGSTFDDAVAWIEQHVDS